MLHLTQSRRRLLFLFYGAISPVEALGGGPLPCKEVWTLRCLPGGFVASGKTLDEADANLRGLIECHMKAIGDPAVWYTAAHEAMSKPDRATFGGLMGDVSVIQDLNIRDNVGVSRALAADVDNPA